MFLWSDTRVTQALGITFKILDGRLLEVDSLEIAQDTSLQMNEGRLGASVRKAQRPLNGLSYDLASSQPPLSTGFYFFSVTSTLYC